MYNLGSFFEEYDKKGIMLWMLVTLTKPNCWFKSFMKSYMLVFSEYVFARFLEIFHNHPDPFDCEYLFNLNLWNLIITKVLALLLSTCPIVFDFWELSHVIFLKLRKKQLLAKLSKFTNWQLKMVLSFDMICRLGIKSVFKKK